MLLLWLLLSLLLMAPGAYASADEALTLEPSPAACRESPQAPQCRAAERGQRQAEQEIEARFQRLPWWEKLLRWALLPAGLALAWAVVGRIRARPRADVFGSADSSSLPDEAAREPSDAPSQFHITAPAPLREH
ncbi:MAG: hypothetical protein ABW005_03745 [Burkholderiaceae bacterium]